MTEVFAWLVRDVWFDDVSASHRWGATVRAGSRLRLRSQPASAEDVVQAYYAADERLQAWVAGSSVDLKGLV